MSSLHVFLVTAPIFFLLGCIANILWNAVVWPWIKNGIASEANKIKRL